MKKIRNTIIVFVLLGFAIAFIQPIGYIAVMLGWAGLQTLSIRPDQNMDFSVEIEMPTKERVKFSGQTGCEHFVGANGTGYKTLNRSAVSENGKWLLYGIDCNYGIRRKGYETYYKIFSLKNLKISSVYFVTEHSPTKVISEHFSSSIFSRLNKTETYWPKFDEGPYFYRKIYLKETPTELAEIKSPKILYFQQTCGKENEESKRFQLPKDFSFTYDKYTKYSTGTLEYFQDDDAWHIGDAINLEDGLTVSARNYKPGTNIPISGAPAECLLFNYQGERFYMSQALYLPNENAIIQIERIHHSDFERAIALSNTWGQCEGDIAIPLPEENVIYIDKSPYTVINRGISINLTHSRLIKNDSGTYKCSKFQWLNWI